MSAGAIVMFLVAAIGLWGGCGVSIAIAMRHNKKNKPKMAQADGGEEKPEK